MITLEASGLRKTYRTARGIVAAVDGVDLTVEGGEFLAICGRSGSGKSTLLGLLGGLCRPSEGRVTVDGFDLARLNARALADHRAQRFGFLFQFAGLLPNLRAVDNVALPALLRGAGYDEAYARAHDLLGQVGLAERWDAHASELSGGQQRRIAIARALVNRPAVLLADEPTNDLDEQAEAEVLALIHELQRKHAMTLIVVTHNIELAHRADRVVRLSAGRVVVRESRRGRAVMGGDPVPRVTESASLAAEPVFEPAPATLEAAEPTRAGTGMDRLLTAFVVWALVIACGLFVLDRVAARRQRKTIDVDLAKQTRSEQLALQQLRADIDDVVGRPDGSYQVSIYLENLKSGSPFFVLGPAMKVYVQVDQRWQPLSVQGSTDAVVRSVDGKQTYPVTFRADEPHFDELVAGYMHIRISNVMVVSDSSDPTGNPFERSDDYYIYLKPQGLSDDEVRRRNDWRPGAVVPRWIAMPPH